MKLPDSFFKDEFRSDYLVTSLRKKVWAVELNLLEKFDQVCRAHNLQYFVDYGTLLGAVRHNGFIPWDDDIDVTMFRNDYEKLKSIASEAFTTPYFFQDGYTDIMLWAFSKIRDDRTTAIEFPEIASNFHQGIFLDIFPLDDAPDGIHTKSFIRDIQKELWQTIVNPNEMLTLLSQGYPFILDGTLILDLLKMSPQQRLREFENFNLSQFGKSRNVNFITDELLGLSSSMQRDWYADTIYLPFEHLNVPAPVGYDSILRAHYGDYMTPVMNASYHSGIFFDPDTPYLQYMASHS